MSAGARVAVFVALLVAIFAGAAFVGSALGHEDRRGHVHAAATARAIGP
jgi:hypothetical protein